MNNTKNHKNAIAEETVQLVTFQVGSEEYGLDIQCITEAVRPLKITPLPKMPEFIEGVINLRGVIIPIVDLRKRFALARIVDNPKKMRMLITRGGVSGGSRGNAGLIGLLVDDVHEVLHIPKKNIEQTPEAAMGQHDEFITGVGKTGDRLVILIDTAKILSQHERSELAEAGNAGY